MSGLVLLDEDQQRTLYSSRGELRPAPPGTRRSGSTPSSQGSEPRTDFTARGVYHSPWTDFTSRGAAAALRSPRTDFSSRGGGRAAHSPRTDFTSRANHSPRTDFTTNQGLPRTNFTTVGSGGKPSIATLKSSPRTNFATHRSAMDGRFDGADSYPMLRRDSDDADSSADDTESDAANTAHRYAGTSSGLKISVRWILVGVAVGVALGVAFSQMHVSSLAAQWISLPGDLFLRALKCLVVPYVFCSVAVAMGDIVFVGKVSVVGLQTAKIFVIMWISTVTMGVGVALLFRPLFRLNQVYTAVPLNSIGFGCANNRTAVIQENSTIACVGDAAVELARGSAFVVDDVNGLFATNTKTIASLSLSDQLLSMITPIVSSNIIYSLANSELLSVITFSMVLGSVAGRSYFTKTRHINYLYLVLLQLRNTFFLAMEWTIWLSPVAVVSVIAGSFATNQESLRQISNAYVYVLATICAAVLQTLVLFPAIVFLMTSCNPYTHMRKMLRAYVFAFACSSSLATAPVTLGCARKARVCSQSLANFVISIGVTSNVSAVGFYFPIAVVFLAESSGNGDQLTVLRIIGIYALSFLSCAGTPPIPSSGLATITTIYTTIFGVSSMPETFPYVVAMDFLLDRFATVCDVNDDIMALKVIAENTDETVAQEHLGERF